MPNLRSQELTADGFTMVASDGRTFTMTRAVAMAHFRTLNGSRANKIAATIQWVKEGIETALGPEQVPALLLDFDFDDIAGMKHLGVRS